MTDPVTMRRAKSSSGAKSSSEVRSLNDLDLHVNEFRGTKLEEVASYSFSLSDIADYSLRNEFFKALKNSEYSTFKIWYLE